MAHATATTTAASAPDTSTRPSGLRSLHLIRAAVSFAWAALVLTTSSSLVATDQVSAAAAVLLVGYPLWDVAATLLERRLAGAGSGPTHRFGTVTIAVGLAAAVAMLIAALGTVGDALLVFGVWALASGALQLVVAIRRRRTVGAQWTMLISGGLSVLAGASFAAMSASETSGLSSLAGYAAFGGFWFLVSAIALTRHGRSGPANGPRG